MIKALFCSMVIFFTTLSAYELGVISMFKNEAPHFKEWIEYHRLAGVEHFWLYDNGSTDNWQEALAPYIKEGLVEVINWPSPNPPIFWGFVQVKAFQDGLSKARGKARWVAVIDLDEFIVPMKDQTIQACLEKRFVGTSGVYVNWRNFGTSHLTIPRGTLFLFQLTSCSLPFHTDNYVGKSIVQPDKVRLEDVYYPHHFPLKGGFQYVNGDNIPMPFRGNDLLTDGLHHGNYLRINHYVLRDESDFQNYRLPRAVREEDRNILMEHYQSFNLIKDQAICKFIRNNYPEKYQEIWVNK